MAGPGIDGFSTATAMQALQSPLRAAYCMRRFEWRASAGMSRPQRVRPAGPVGFSVCRTILYLSLPTRMYSPMGSATYQVDAKAACA